MITGVIRLRIKQLHTMNQRGQEPTELRVKQGQVVRARVVQLYPNNQARIEFGSFQFIAQLVAPLENGRTYFFQVRDVKQQIHLQVIEQSNKPNKNEWQQLLGYMGMKQSTLNEQFIQRIIQADIPFTNRSLQQAITLLSSSSHSSLAMHTLTHMMQQDMPLTKDIFQSLMTLHSSTWTETLMHAYEEVMRLNTRGSEQLISHLETWLPEKMRLNHMLTPIHRYVMTDTDLRMVRQLRSLIPQIDFRQIEQVERLSLEIRRERFHTPAQLFTHLLKDAGPTRELPIQTWRAISSSPEVFQNQIAHIVEQFDRTLQPHIPVNQTTNAQVIQSIETLGSIGEFPQEQVDVLRQHVRTNAQDLHQIMIDLKEIGQTLHQLIGEDRMNETKPILPRPHMSSILTEWIKQIGRSYERSIVDGQTGELIHSLKGQLLQFIQTQGNSASRAESLLQFIQGMQLQMVQETAHMLSVHMQIPAVIGTLRSDVHVQLEGKKTPDNSLDPNYCRIVFDLDLASLERTFIDMHVQNKQVSFVIYNDFPMLKSIARGLEPSLIENLRKIDYIVTSIRYQSLQEKPKQSSHVRQEKEGIDLKI